MTEKFIYNATFSFFKEGKNVNANNWREIITKHIPEMDEDEIADIIEDLTVDKYPEDNSAEMADYIYEEVELEEILKYSRFVNIEVHKTSVNITLCFNY